MKCNVFNYFMLVTSIVFYSCSGRELDEGHSVFRRPEVKFKDLAGQLIPIDSIKKPEEILVIPEKNLLVIRDVGPYLAKAFSLDDLSFKKSFIKQGEGPDEQLISFSLQYVQGQNVLYSSDPYKKMVFSYPVDSVTMGQPEVSPNKVIKIKTDYLVKPVFVNDKIISTRHNHDDSVALLDFFDQEGNLLSSNGSFPENFKEYDPQNLVMVTQVTINASQDGKYLVASYSSTDIIDLLDAEGNLIKRIQGPDLFETKYNLQELDGGATIFSPEKGSKTAYSATAKMGNDAVYILYKGIYEDPNDYHAGTLFHFNQELELENAYALEIPIFDFDIDWTTNTIYGLTHNHEDKIVVFELK